MERSGPRDHAPEPSDEGAETRSEWSEGDAEAGPQSWPESDRAEPAGQERVSRPGAPLTESSNRRRNTLLIAGAIALAFLIGFGWQFVRAQRLSAELAATQRELTVRSLEATLATATVEAQRGNYESARLLASRFFSGLQAGIADAPAPAQPALSNVLAQRDTTITALSRGAPVSTELLTDQLERYRVAVHGQDQALPLPPAAGEPEG